MATVSSWRRCGAMWSWQMQRCMMSVQLVNLCIDGLSFRNCWNSPATWCWAISCTGRTPSPLHNMGWCWVRGSYPSSYWWLVCRGLCTPRRCLSLLALTHHQIGNAGWCCRKRNLLRRNSGHIRPSHMLREPVNICEKNRELGKNLPILVFSGNVGDVTPSLPRHGACICIVWAETCTDVSTYSSFCRALTVLPYLLAQGADCCFVALLWPPPPLLVYWPVSWYLLYALDTVLGHRKPSIHDKNVDAICRSWLNAFPASVGCRYCSRQKGWWVATVISPTIKILSHWLTAEVLQHSSGTSLLQRCSYEEPTWWFLLCMSANVVIHSAEEFTHPVHSNSGQREIQGNLVKTAEFECCPMIKSCVASAHLCIFKRHCCWIEGQLT